MGRAAESVDDLNECFERFDKAFDAFSSQLEWTVPEDPIRLAAEAHPANDVARQRTIEPDSAEPPELAQSLDAALDLLDDRLAQCQASDAEVPPATGRAAQSPPPEALAPPRVAAFPRVASVVPSALARAAKSLPRYDLPGGVTPLGNLLAVLEELSAIESRLAAQPTYGSDPGSREVLARAFADARQMCVDFNLHTARVRTDFALAALEDAQGERLRTEIDELVRHIRHDLQFCSIWPVAASRVWWFEQTFGHVVSAAFPSSQDDISEGGMCLGLGRYTACVFHMVRGAERALRALARAADARAKGIDQAGWSDLIAIIDRRLTTVAAWPAGRAKTAAQEFFQGALFDVRSLHESERRLMSGVAGQPFDEHEAASVYNRTRDLLTRLSARITETHQDTLGKRDFAR